MGCEVSVNGITICECDNQKDADSILYCLEKSTDFSQNEMLDTKTLVSIGMTSMLCYVVKKNFATNNYNYTHPKEMKVKGIMLHSPASSRQDALKEIAKDFNVSKEAKKSACTHAVIDGNNGRVFQILPWNWKAYHCAGDFNSSHIAIDMCDPSVVKYTKNKRGNRIIEFNKPKDTSYLQALEVVDRTYQSAVQLCTALCIMFDLDPLGTGKGSDGKQYPNVIISHREGYVRFNNASNHGDPEKLWDEFKKDRNYSMDSFRQAVYDELQKYKKSGYYVPIQLIQN